MKYRCGHKSESIIIDDNILSLSALMDWNDGDKTKCWDCYCKESQSSSNKLKSQKKKQNGNNKKRS